MQIKKELYKNTSGVSTMYSQASNKEWRENTSIKKLMKHDNKKCITMEKRFIHNQIGRIFFANVLLRRSSKSFSLCSFFFL